jgi:hypothetical protein
MQMLGALAGRGTRPFSAPWPPFGHWCPNATRSTVLHRNPPAAKTRKRAGIFRNGASETRTHDLLGAMRRGKAANPAQPCGMPAVCAALNYLCFGVFPGVLAHREALVGQTRGHTRVAASDSFRSTLNRVEVHPTRRESTVSPRRMSSTPSIMLWSSKMLAKIPTVGFIGPDRAGNFLEAVVMTTAEGDQLVIDAMPMRARFRRLLEP